MNIRLADKPMTFDSTIDGPGIRNVIWTQGCTHKCAGCHNPSTHSFNGGKDYNADSIIKTLIMLREDTHIDKVTFSGGDPMLQYEALEYICRELKSKGFNIWVYTGYTFEYIFSMSNMRSVLKYVDVLVDGRFEQSLKDLTLPFRGSKNQRVIDVTSSLEAHMPLIIKKYTTAETLSLSQEI